MPPTRELLSSGKPPGAGGMELLWVHYERGERKPQRSRFCRVRAQSTLSAEPELKQTLWDVFEQIQRFRDEYIARLEFRHGLPILVETTAPAHFSK